MAEPHLKDLKALSLAAVPEDDVLTALNRQICFICCVPFPFEDGTSSICCSCGGRVCHGCVVKDALKRKKYDSEGRLLRGACFLCRDPGTDFTDVSQIAVASTLRILRHRAIENDHDAMYKLGVFNFKKDEELTSTNNMVAREWFERSSQAGNARASFMMARFMQLEGGELDTELYQMYLEQAARRGYLPARYHLAMNCGYDGDIGMATAHAMYAACEGDDKSLDLCSKLRFSHPKFFSQDDYKMAQKAHESAHKERNTNDRKFAKLFIERYPKFSFVMDDETE